MDKNKLDYIYKKLKEKEKRRKYWRFSFSNISWLNIIAAIVTIIVINIIVNGITDSAYITNKFIAILSAGTFGMITIKFFLDRISYEDSTKIHEVWEWVNKQKENENKDKDQDTKR